MKDADAWLGLARAEPEKAGFASEVAGVAAPCIGLEPLADVYAKTAHIRAVSGYAQGERGFLRLEAPVFAWNLASMRVLEKCGYQREAVMGRSAFKDGEVIDSVLYARVKQ